MFKEDNLFELEAMNQYIYDTQIDGYSQSVSTCNTSVSLCCYCVFQLLDCFVIPVLMVLSWFLLKTRYKLVHFIAVMVCLLGVGAMVGADILAGRDQGSSKDTL